MACMPPISKKALLVLSVSSLIGASAQAATYEVGPGKTYANIGDAPLESLKAGDTLLIYGRSTPYREKFALQGAGTANAPVIVRGVRGADGKRPQILGANATTRRQLDFYSEARGIINILGQASYVTVEGLDITGARGSFTTKTGAASTYAKNASAIFLIEGDHITIRDCEMHDAGNGFFSAGGSNVLLEANYIYDNGNPGSVYEHNNYTESNQITFQYNHFGPLCSGCSGNNLKDRSAGTVIRYNWIDNGNRTLDLVESENYTTAPGYHTTMVYGNVLIERDGGNAQIVHYGGDNGDTENYRKGTLHFVHNTIVSFRSGKAVVLGLETSEETAEVRNNIIYAKTGSISMADGSGKLIMSGNWISSGWTPNADSVSEPNPQKVGSAPGFVDVANLDFHLTDTAAARNAAGPLETGAPIVDRQYVVHQGSEARPSDGTPDIGAFEYGSTTPSVDAAPPAPVVDALPPVSVVDAAPKPAVDARPSTSSPDASRSDNPPKSDGGPVNPSVRLDGGAVDARTVDSRMSVIDAGPVSIDAKSHPVTADAGTPVATSAGASGCSSFPTGPATGSAGWLSVFGLLLVVGLRRRR